MSTYDKMCFIELGYLIVITSAVVVLAFISAKIKGY